MCSQDSVHLTVCHDVSMATPLLPYMTIQLISVCFNATTSPFFVLILDCSMRPVLIIRILHSVCFLCCRAFLLYKKKKPQCTKVMFMVGLLSATINSKAKE